jgi:hypothetical protein
VPPETIMEMLQRSGFVNVSHQVWGGGVQSEYIAAKPSTR